MFCTLGVRWNTFRVKKKKSKAQGYLGFKKHNKLGTQVHILSFFEVSVSYRTHYFGPKGHQQIHKSSAYTQFLSPFLLKKWVSWSFLKFPASALGSLRAEVAERGTHVRSLHIPAPTFTALCTTLYLAILMRNRPLCTSSYLHFCTNLRLKLSCAYLTSLCAEPGSPLYLSFVGPALWSLQVCKGTHLRARFVPVCPRGSRMGESQHPDPGSGMNNPDHIF
jgi:hypothetical protein